MASAEARADEQLVGLGSDAEERLPAEGVRRRERAHDGFVLVLLIGVQLVWLAALVYASYVFIGG